MTEPQTHTGTHTHTHRHTHTHTHTQWSGNCHTSSSLLPHSCVCEVSSSAVLHSLYELILDQFSLCVYDRCRSGHFLFALILDQLLLSNTNNTVNMADYLP